MITGIITPKKSAATPTSAPTAKISLSSSTKPGSTSTAPLHLLLSSAVLSHWSMSSARTWVNQRWGLSIRCCMLIRVRWMMLLLAQTLVARRTGFRPLVGGIRLQDWGHRIIKGCWLFGMLCLNEAFREGRAGNQII